MHDFTPRECMRDFKAGSPVQGSLYIHMLRSIITQENQQIDQTAAMNISSIPEFIHSSFPLEDSLLELLLLCCCCQSQYTVMLHTINLVGSSTT